MNAYTIPISCHHCRGALTHVNGTGRDDSLEQVAITECLSCGRSWSVLVQLRPMPSAESRRRHALREASR